MIKIDNIITNVMRILEKLIAMTVLSSEIDSYNLEYIMWEVII